jgi:hypothetical protein
LTQTPELLLAVQQIQVLDYELHAALRLIGKGQMSPEHASIFMEVSARRDRLMARVFTHLVMQRKESLNPSLKRRA